MDAKNRLTNEQVNRYSIIDDENDMLPKQQEHFVQTYSQFGILSKDAERVITIYDKKYGK